jgi:hypothetical protein
MKKMTKQQVAVAEEKCTRIKAVLATLTMQRCANKLAKRGKDERERERGEGEIHKRVKKNVISLYNINIYFSSLFLFLRH